MSKVFLACGIKFKHAERTIANITGQRGKPAGGSEVLKHG